MFALDKREFCLNNLRVRNFGVCNLVLDKLNCFLAPHSNTEYSTYTVKNCQEFKDGVCTGMKNNSRMNLFLSNFHKKYSDAYCNKKSSLDSLLCVR